MFLQPHALVPTVEVEESAECCYRDDAKKYEPPLWFPRGGGVERVGWFQYGIHYGLRQAKVETTVQVST